MQIGILNFVEGSLAVNYLIFCAVASLGVLQITAARERLVGLMLFQESVTLWIGTALLVGSFIWFFDIQTNLFIPGLAGGELTTLFTAGFGIALIATLALCSIARRIPRPHGAWQRERVRLADGRKAELWRPNSHQPPLVFAFRETATDSLDRLAEELVMAGAAVLLCDAGADPAALDLFARQRADHLHPSRRYTVGIGRGAVSALQWSATSDSRLRACVALAPSLDEQHRRPGLGWLREGDYLTVLEMTLRQAPLPPRPELADALIICGDEDFLLPPATARRLFPGALMVAGARHFTLAAMPATIRLTLDHLELHPARVPIRRSVRSEARE